MNLFSYEYYFKMIKDRGNQEALKKRDENERKFDSVLRRYMQTPEAEEQQENNELHIWCRVVDRYIVGGHTKEEGEKYAMSEYRRIIQNGGL